MHQSIADDNETARLERDESSPVQLTFLRVRGDVVKRE
jgi:hypothetical protein